MPKYLGPRQLAECMRSGVKCYASELVRDGRNPHLLVLPRYADPAQPQERPFKPDDAEGRARFPLAPDHGDDTPPVLSGESAQAASLLIAGFNPLYSPARFGWIDSVESETLGDIGSFDPATGFGNGEVVLIEYGTVSERYTVGLDSGAENAPPAADALLDLVFADDVETVTLVAANADSTFEGVADTAFSGRRYWKFDNYVGSRFTPGNTYSVVAPTLIELTWTQAETIGPRVESYKVYRAIGAGAFALIETLPVEFGPAPDYTETHTLATTDSDVSADIAYRYRIDAVTEDLRVLASNIITVSFEAPVPAAPIAVTPPSAPVLGGSELPVEV